MQVSDLDRRVRRGRERLAQEVEPAPPAALSAEKSEQLSVLEEKIKNLLEQVESLGEAGKVDEAEALMRKVSGHPLFPLLHEIFWCMPRKGPFFCVGIMLNFQPRHFKQWTPLLSNSSS